MAKRFDPEVRARALRLLAEHGQEYPTRTAAIEALAPRVGVARETLRRWMLQADIDRGDRPGTTSEESEEIQKLKAENKRLREDVAVLKAATTFFAGELDPRNR